MSLSSCKFFVCLAALAFLVGCGGGAADVGAIAVSGTVTLDGQPAEGARVAFSPKTEGGRAAAGVTDASGRFTLTSVTSGDGALPGSYGVTVSKTKGTELPSVYVAPEDVTKLTPEEHAEYQASLSEMAKKAKEVIDLLPKKYRLLGESGLTAEVKKGEKNDFTFALTSN